MSFIKYQHVEKYGNEEVNGIDIGTCFIFSKLDGTNASLWFDNEIKFGSRNRELSLDKDNANFMKTYIQDKRIQNFFTDNKNLILYGEFLVKHSIKDYQDTAWNKFYIFDVCEKENDEIKRYLPYEEYQPLLEKYNLDYLPPQKIIKNPTYENLLVEMNNCNFLMKDGFLGEGIVIKNYSFINKYGRITWAKMVRNEFKEVHYKTIGTPIIENKLIEEKFLDVSLTTSLIEKTAAKIIINRQVDLWSTKFIPELFNRVWKDLIIEELYDFVNKGKDTINFKTLYTLMIIKIKQLKPELF